MTGDSDRSLLEANSLSRATREYEPVSGTVPKSTTPNKSTLQHVKKMGLATKHWTMEYVSPCFRFCNPILGFELGKAVECLELPDLLRLVRGEGTSMVIIKQPCAVVGRVYCKIAKKRGCEGVWFLVQNFQISGR